MSVPGQSTPRQAIFTGSYFVRKIYGYGADGKPLPGEWPAGVGPTVAGPDGSFGGSIYFPAVGRSGTQTAVFAGSNGDQYAWGSLYALNGQGEPLDGDWPWTYPGRAQMNNFSPALAEPPALAGPAAATLYFAYRDVDSNNYSLTALRADGTPREGWPVETGATGNFAGPAVGPDGTIYLASYLPGEQYNQDHPAIEAFTPAGEPKHGWPVELWDDNADIWLAAPAIAPDGTVYIGVEDQRPYFDEGTSHYYALTPDGHMKDGWPIALPTSIVGPPAIARDGSTYVATHTAEGSERVASVYAFSADGEMKPGWPLRFEHWGGGKENGEIVGIAVDAHGNVFFGSGDTMYGYAPDGRLLLGWPLKFADAARLNSPALADDGTLYISSVSPQGGKIYAVRSMD